VTPDISIGFATRYHWSPDGRFIAYIERRAIELVSPSGGQPRILIESSDSLPQWTFQNLVWSTDSRFVYFKGHDAGGEEGLWSVPIAGGPPRQVVRFDDPATEFGRGGFAASRDRFYFPLEKRESDIWTAEVLTR